MACKDDRGIAGKRPFQGFGGLCLTLAVLLVLAGGSSSSVGAARPPSETPGLDALVNAEGLSAVCRARQGPGGRPQVCMDAFLDVLNDYGTWVLADRFGTLFCPNPAVYGPDFHPYAKGHWAMSENGWTFVGEQPVSWVTEHYGRWVETDVPSCPWGWVPGDIWSPAWVEFRVGDNVVAWRPARWSGQPVRLNLPAGTRLSQVRAEQARPARSAELDEGYVAVRDGDFQANHLGDLVLSGPDRHAALRETAYLPNVQAGLHSRTRDEVVAQMQSAHEVERVAAQLTGEPPEPASRFPGSAGKGRGKGAAGTVVAGRKGREKFGPGGVPQKAGDTPPGAGKVYWGGDQGSFQNPGPQGGVKVLEWGKPKPPQPPKQEPASP